MTLKTSVPRPRTYPKKRRTWLLNKPEKMAEFSRLVSESLNAAQPTPDIDQTWTDIKSSLTDACEKVCGWTKGGKARRHQETWWWNTEVDDAIKAKRKAWKDWQKNGGSKEIYLATKRQAKKVVYTAKRKADEERFKDIRTNDQKNAIFKLAKRMKEENSYVIGEKSVKDSNGIVAFTDAEKLAVWKAHYEKLLNVEFPWDSESLPELPPVQGPPPHVSIEIVEAAIKKLKRGKAAGPSGIIAEMLRCNSPILKESLTRLTNDVIRDGKIPAEWDLSYIINCYKGKGDSMSCGNYRGLKLLDQGLKVFERVIETILRTHVNIDSMQFGFMPGRGTTDPIFILRQLHEKYMEKKKDLYFLFVDLEKAFDRVPRSVIWWALRKMSVPEWLVRTVQAMYKEAKSSVRINNSFSAEFDVTVGVHQGSVLSPLLFIIVMEALSQEFRTGCPWELLYADDLVIVAESLEELTNKFRLWKQGMEAKGLRVNMTKTKILCSQGSQRKQQATSSKHPCGICYHGVGSNSIYCGQCKHWVHKSCSGIKGRLKQDPHFVCRRCKNELPPPPTRTTEFIFDGSPIESVPTFCYLGDTNGSAGGCHDAITARIKCAWKSFRELLPILTNPAISPLHRGGIFNACIRRVMLHASETWPVTV